VRPWPLFWASLALTLAGAAMIFIGTGPAIDAATGGLAAPETRPGGHGAEDLAAYLAVLGPEGRDTYLGPQRIADTLFPIGFLGTLALGSFLALRRFSTRLALLATLPAFVYFAFDMVENARFAAILRAGPGFAPALAVRAGFATRMKFLFVDLALAVLALALAARAVARLRSRRG
jgi:hypothetical protein